MVRETRIASSLLLLASLSLLAGGAASGEDARRIFGIAPGEGSARLDDEDPDMDRMSDVGVQRLRLGGKPSDFQASGTCNRFQGLMKSVMAAERKGIEPLVLIDIDAWKGGRTSAKEYAEFARAIAIATLGHVSHFELLNEPENYGPGGFYEDLPSVSPEELAEYAVAGYRALKGVNADCVVVGPALGTMDDSNLQYLDRFLTALGKESGFDVMGIHAYRPEGPEDPREPDGRTFEEDLLQLQRLLGSHDRAGTHVWITEVAWTAGIKDAQVTEDEQAEYLAQTYSAALSTPALSFVDAVFWYELRDPASDTGVPGYGSGIVHFDGTEKPAYGAYRALATANSRSFFPIGMYAVDDPNDFPEIAEAGFNLVQSYKFEGIETATDEEALAYLEAARRSGLRVLMGIPQEAVLKEDLAVIEKRVRALKDHPALFGWQLFDEPENAATLAEVYGKGQGAVSPESFRRAYQTIKRIDPRHPVTLACSTVLDEEYAYLEGADTVIGEYAAPPDGVWEAPFDTLENLMSVLKSDARFLGARGKSFLPGTFAYNPANDHFLWPPHLPRSMGRYPTEDEMRLVAWESIIQGGQGVLIVCYRFDYGDGSDSGDDISRMANPEQWAAVSAVASDLKAMGPILLSPSLEPEKAGVTLTGGGVVDLMIKEHDGNTYLVTANPSSSPVEGEISLDPARFPAPTLVSLPDREERTPVQGVWTVRWEPYEVRIFEVVKQMSLRALAEGRGILIGNVLSDSFGWTDDPEMARLAEREFNAGMLEAYWMEVNAEERGKYDFTYPDRLLAQANRANQRVLGHTLVYSYEAMLPAWLTKGNFTREEYIELIQEHVHAVMLHYKGRIDTWIPVNEYDQGNGEPGSGWDYDFFKQKIGPEYVQIAFEAARKADPAATLLYNDNNNETAAGAQTEPTRQIVERLRARGLIDGVGLQFHLDGSNPPSRQDLVSTMRSYGLPVYITELDVDIRHVPGTQEERWAHQAEIYKTVLEAALEVGAKYIGFWGPVDKYNWLESQPSATEVSPDADPGIFDDQLRPKPAYAAWVSILNGKTTGLPPQGSGPATK